MEAKKNDPMTVSQLTNLVKEMLEGSFQNISLKGEISNFKPSSAGHIYFSLKDSESQIAAVMFRGAAAALNFLPKDGMMVTVRGKITVYAPRGNYQIQVSSMIQSGTGDIMEMLEIRKRKFAAEGLFDGSRKKKIPRFPKTVGIVTSANGAGLRDILNIRRRRNDKVSVIIFPTLVQGEEAAKNISYMIKVANRFKMCDVLIVGRGGGSLEDLLPFSEEIVVRAISDSVIPVISAVGHEIDWALSDFVADERAPTPSAAAEIAIPLKEQTTEQIRQYAENLKSEMHDRIENLRLLLRAFNVNNMVTRLENIEQKYSERFDRAFDSLKNSMEKILLEKRTKINFFRQNLENCNPQFVFDRGFSMVCDQNGKIIRNAAQISPGQKIEIRPASGKIFASVEKIEIHQGEKK
jgi:exodeoxyribonuclease VII large subunit